MSGEGYVVARESAAVDLTFAGGIVRQIIWGGRRYLASEAAVRQHPELFRPLEPPRSSKAGSVTSAHAPSRRAGTFVATESAVVIGDEGRSEEIKAAQTHVHDAGHYLVVTYPHLFRRLTRPSRDRQRRVALTPRRPMKAQATPPAKAASRKPLVRVSTASPSFSVRLSERAYADISDQAFALRGRAETGGALFGQVPGSRASSLARVLAPGPTTRATRLSLDFDRAHVHAELQQLRRDGNPYSLVGSWHTHPCPGTGRPSDGDLRAFALNCRQILHLTGRIEHYVALIVTPQWRRSYGSEAYACWAKPTISAWHLQAVADDEFICTRAEAMRP